MTESTRARLTLAARILLPVYLVVLGYIVFSPSDEATETPGIVAWLFDAVDHLRDSLPPAYVALEFVANIALFVPFGLLVRIAFGRLPWWAVAALGLATTVTIELVQSTLPTRFSTVSDVIANTAGTLLGLLVARAVRRRPDQSSGMSRLPSDTVPSGS
jgi:glycopeptide antibiotics resistance protein